MTTLTCPTFHYNFPSIGHKGPEDRVQVQNRPIDLIPTIFRKDITAWICQNLATKHLQSVVNEQIEAKSSECSGSYKRHNHNSVGKGEEKMDAERGEWERATWPSG